ncbi:MAG: hypothetical protein AB1349_06125 [Elusimicrobiota bacterium]
MKTKKWLCGYVIKWFVFTIHLFTYPLIHCLYCQVDPEVYFNSGIDKYVKGNYDDAIALFEQTLTLKPDHQKAKSFLVNVLTEATEKQIMLSNYQKAKEYIKKAKDISPDNPKVVELEKIVEGTTIKIPQKPIETKKTAEQKPSFIKPVIKKYEALNIIHKVEEPVSVKPSTGIPYKYFLAVSIILIIGLIIVVKKKINANTKKFRELEIKIRADAEKKFKQELEQMKKTEEEALQKLKIEVTEKLKLQLAEKKAIAEMEQEKIVKQFEATLDEEKVLDTITDLLKKNDYSKRIIQSMTVSIRTMLYANKKLGLENILRLSKNDNPRLRYDCIKIIENVLTKETFSILLEMLNDTDYEVKRTAIGSVNNICKAHPAEIPSEMLSKAQKQLTEQKIKNGWII